LADDQRLASIKAAADGFFGEQRTIMRHCVLTLKGKLSAYNLFPRICTIRLTHRNRKNWCRLQGSRASSESRRSRCIKSLVNR
jgi:hypothetical protein